MQKPPLDPDVADTTPSDSLLTTFGAMSTGHSAFQVRARYGVALIDRGLLRLILRGVRQRAFVVCR